MSDEAQAAASESQQPLFSIEKIYVKDASVEIPNAPAIFLEREAPQIEVQLSTEGGNVAEGIFGATITVTVTAKLGERTMFLVEVTQGGVFQVRNVPAAELGPILGIACPNILFPYLRETVSDLTVRAGFPPVLLNPVNFEALYAQQQAARAQGEAATNGSGATH
ncbi:MAG: protein-export chaperone SecB [Pseudomonadota bacterium]|nr:protein-export chaperone SecB [Pseudomonadota bacterium]